MGAFEVLKRVKRHWGIALLLGLGLTFAGSSQAKTSHHLVKCRVGYTRRLVSVPARKRGRIVRHHGKIVHTRVWACVKVAKPRPKPKPKPGGTTTNSGTTSTTTSTTNPPPPPPPPAPPTNTQRPAISGPADVGSPLSASPGSWTNSPTNYGYQWQDCASGVCTNINGATSSSYTLMKGDLGDTVDVQVTASNDAGANSATSSPVGPVITATTYTVVAVGDIACPATGGPSCQQAATEALAQAQNPNAVFVLGDNQYDNGTFAEYTSTGAYNDTWGFFGCALCVNPPIVHPVPGNHEYGDPGAAGYFQYFGQGIANPDKTANGYYSFNLGSWHIDALNSNCSDSGCSDPLPGTTTTAQTSWLQTDLAHDTSACTLAMWHHPLFSSGWTLGSPGVVDLWSALYKAHADVVLNGHDHLYERYALQDPSGNATTSGIREFVVGTGGESLNGISTAQPNLEASDSQFGVLVLTLHPSSYDYKFISTSGTTLDSGTGVPCHGPSGSAVPSVAAARDGAASGAPVPGLSGPPLVFDAHPLASSLAAVERRGLRVAIHADRGVDVVVTASVRRGGRLHRIASFYETESQIPKPYSQILLHLSARRLAGNGPVTLVLRFAALDSAFHRRVVTKIVRLSRR